MTAKWTMYLVGRAASDRGDVEWWTITDGVDRWVPAARAAFLFESKVSAGLKARSEPGARVFGVTLKVDV